MEDLSKSFKTFNLNESSVLTSSQATLVSLCKLDEETLKEYNKYVTRHPELVSLLTQINFEILDKKPTDIIRYLNDEFFHAKNHSNLYEKLNIKPPNK